MSFNVRWDGLDEGRNAWENRRPLVIDLLQTFSPDVCGLQEPSRVQSSDLDAGLADYACYVGEHRRDETIPILYKASRFRLLDAGSFWLIERSDLSGGTRRCVWVRLQDKASGNTFYVYNCHLDHRSEESRLQSAQVLVQTISERKPADPFVLCGDFNEVETGKAMRYLGGDRDLRAKKTSHPELILTDTFRMLNPPEENQGTGHGFKGIKTRNRIDYLWTGDDWEVLAADIVHYNKDGFYPSDHFPVTARLKISKR